PENRPRRWDLAEALTAGSGSGSECSRACGAEPEEHSPAQPRAAALRRQQPGIGTGTGSAASRDFQHPQYFWYHPVVTSSLEHIPRLQPDIFHSLVIEVTY
ncbi:hypothetical protein scyTo_0010618, partial [Scyliorhinus torazame]|nr:hypothetical protein [Scyliorhinus torazame]